jgi:pilus assembly protein Flp/PilA
VSRLTECDVGEPPFLVSIPGIDLPDSAHWRARLRYSLNAVANLLLKLRVLLDQRGQGMVEYALILVLVAIVVIVALTTMGTAISSKFGQITTGLNSAGGG